MKKLEWIHGNKARITTGHKTFDQQCAFVTTGNVISDNQFSTHVRPVAETECNGHKFARGELRAFDLKHMGRLPRALRRAIDNTSVPVILYQFRHFVRSSGRSIVHGYVLTHTSAKNYALIGVYQTPQTSYKSRKVLDWVKDYISNPAEVACVSLSG